MIIFKTELINFPIKLEILLRKLTINESQSK